MNGLNKFHTLEEANKAFKKGTTDIVKLDDTNFSKEIMKRAILMAADYAMRRIDKDSYRLSLIQTRQGFTDYLVHFNFIYQSKFSKAYYVFVDGNNCTLSQEQVALFQELSDIHGFKGICKEAIRLVMDRKKKCKNEKRNINLDDIKEIFQNEDLD